MPYKSDGSYYEGGSIEELVSCISDIRDSLKEINQRQRDADHDRKYGSSEDGRMSAIISSGIEEGIKRILPEIMVSFEDYQINERVKASIRNIAIDTTCPVCGSHKVDSIKNSAAVCYDCKKPYLLSVSVKEIARRNEEHDPKIHIPHERDDLPF